VSARLLARAAAVLVLGLSAGARAETRRLAIVVGHNVGAGDRPSLRYAEDDASKVAHVLIELGGFAERDVRLLLGPTLAQVRASLDEATTRIAALGGHGNRAVLLFYYSGHSDGRALELGGERLPFGEVRGRLRASGADIRLAIVDSCKSGALLREKIGQLASPFEIHFSDDISSTGEALLTSSTDQEAALESQEIHGSFFSHHLVSGLRGAADVSGDGRVTLGEAYNYAFAQTISATYNNLIGPQHPTYRYGLSGQGELVLTEVAHRSAALELPRGFDRLMVQQLESGQLLAELGAGAARRIAVPPGSYRVLGLRGGHLVGAQVSVAQDQSRVLRETDLAQEPVALALAKGDAATVLAAEALGWTPPRRSEAGPVLSLAGGAGAGVAGGSGPLGTFSLGLRRSVASGWEARAVLARGGSPSFHENAAFLQAGYALGGARGPFFARLGLDLGAGWLWQTLQRAEGDLHAWSPAASVGVSAGAGVFLGRHLALTLEGWLPAVLLRRDGAARVVPLPSVVLGLAVPLR
jgi:hypothetical protein